MRSRLLIAAVAATVATATAGVVPVVFLSASSSAATAGSALSHLKPFEKRLLDGAALTELEGTTSAKTAPARMGAQARAGAQAGPGPNLCPVNHGNNVAVNQNCENITDQALQGYAQDANETSIAQNPNNPSQMLAEYNSFQYGDSRCGLSYSSDNGASWTDSQLPDGFVDGTAYGTAPREYMEAGVDPSVAWDTRGNAYSTCVQFQRGSSVANNPDRSSGIFVYRSSNGGASWNFPGRPAVTTLNTTSGLNPVDDKPYLAVDDNPASPYRDRIYLTWTQITPDFDFYIYEEYSDNYGESFSAPVLVSNGSAAQCPQSFGMPTPAGPCDANQWSDPFVGPDGALYVAYANYNNADTGLDNHNQMLLSKSTDGGKSFSAPVVAGSFYDLPSCPENQGGQGIACVPEKGTAQNSVFEQVNYPSGAVNPANPKQVVVTYGSYINRDSNAANGCTPDGFSASTGEGLYTGVKTQGACNNKILISVSNDGGNTFTGSTTDPRNMPVVNTAAGQATTDQFGHWAAFTPSGKLGISYYDRSYGNDETTGDFDESLSTSSDLSHFSVKRVTTSSQPLPTGLTTQDGSNANANSQFMGDFAGLSALNGFHPIWTDTRSTDWFPCVGTGVAGVPPALCPLTEPSGITANVQRISTATIYP